MTLHVDRNGNQVRITYNVDGNPVLERACDRTGANEVIRSWEYDDIGNVKKAVVGGFCYTYEYRTDGKLVRKSSSGRTLVSCTYHADRSLESLTDVSGRTVFYSYDSLGRLERICDEEGTEIARYSHTPGGKLKDIRHGNGMHTVYEYDADDNIIRLRLENQEGAVFSDFRYEYDLNGNRTLKSGSCLLPGEDSLKKQAVRYRYDGMNRLVEERYDSVPVRYVYDRCGNRLEKVDNAGREAYNYNCKNQLSSRKNNLETINYRYDLQGNVLEEASPLGKTEYRYNALNQQTAVFMKDGGIQENQYDAEYLRAEVSENGRRSRFLYYNGELLAESEPRETVTSRYILGYGVAAGWQNGNEGYHSYHLDEQNSTAYITDAGQEIENSYLYDAFGAIRGRQEGIHNRILYTGQQHDQVTGQYYLRARYYNPVVGRFQQEDVHRGDGLNLYAYCANNPVVYYDPSGYSGVFPSNVYSGKDVSSYVDSGRIPDIAAGTKRNSSGIVTGNFTSGYKETGISIFSPDRSTIAIPQSVAQELVGKQYNTFKEFREDFWKTMSGSEYHGEFTKTDLYLMGQGYAPRVSPDLVAPNGQFGTGYNLDHTVEIQDGGYVYDLDNFTIISPKEHAEKTKEENKKRHDCKEG